MKVVYVAGPFRAKNSWDMELNIRRAETLALEVWRSGAAAICPHANTRFYQGAAEDSVWLDGDIEILLRCDAILMTEDWYLSQGAREEKRVADERNMPVFYDIVHLKRWLRTVDGPREDCTSKA